MQRNSGGPIVHIGLGQTGTTSLQLNVFPYIKDLCPEVIYNDIWCMRELASKTHEVMTTKDERLFYDYVNSRNNFISLESLVDWNPRNWVRAADRNLRLFGNSATIIITVKETKVLLHLYKNLGNDVKREKLASDINVSIRTIDVLVKRIREKISCLPNSKNFLLTSRGIGYKLEP